MHDKKIVLVAGEVAPFAKTGGLADVSAALARALHAAGHQVRLYMPLYGSMREAGHAFADVPGMQDIELGFGARRYSVGVRSTPLPGSDLGVFCVDAPDLFHRGGIYTEGEEEAIRFAALTRAAIEGCQRERFAPDVFHVNDWHTALLPLYLRTSYSWDRLFESTRTLLTIHNVAYQGVFPEHIVDDLALGDQPRRALHQGDLAGGAVNFLKTGVLYASALTTVSETYAHEIQGPEYGTGLEDLFVARRDRLFGITNGVDYGIWSPDVDPHIAHPYTPTDLSGKTRCKAALLDELGLPSGTSALAAPLIGIVSRLTSQKGFDLAAEVLPVLLERGDVRVAILGSGDETIERFFHWLASTFPERAAFQNRFDDPLAHRIEAGSDLFLMPSRYEPCGLNQMYSLRYGTIPVVRRTGGLADTVVQYDAESQTGTGFVFDAPDAEALLHALESALAVYRHGEHWQQLVQNAMAVDFSWTRQAERYVQLYEHLRNL